jgi:hypothetical protein
MSRPFSSRAPSSSFDSSLRVGIDGRMKQQIWECLVAFQNSPNETVVKFPADLNNQDRKYVHKAASKLGFTTKSFGSKKVTGARAVHVFKTMEKKVKVDKIAHFLPIPQEIEQEINSFLSRHPTQKLDNLFAPIPLTKSQTSQQRQIHQISENSLFPLPPVDCSIPYPNSSLRSFRENLPTFKHREEIIRLFLHHQVIVISGATGSGNVSFVLPSISIILIAHSLLLFLPFFR